MLCVVQLVRLIQAECEAASIAGDNNADKRAKAAAVLAAKEQVVTPAAPKASPTPPSLPVGSQVAAVATGTGDSVGKGKGKGKGEVLLCHKFGDATGCRFGDSCKFKHDRAKARKEGKCLACGQGGHIRPDCPLVPAEHRVVVSDQGSDGSPKGGAGKGSPKAKPGAKAKAGSQAKGISEDSNPTPEGSGANVSAAVTSPSPTIPKPPSNPYIGNHSWLPVSWVTVLKRPSSWKQFLGSLKTRAMALNITSRSSDG